MYIDKNRNAYFCTTSISMFICCSSNRDLLVCCHYVIDCTKEDEPAKNKKRDQVIRSMSIKSCCEGHTKIRQEEDKAPHTGNDHVAESLLSNT